MHDARPGSGWYVPNPQSMHGAREVANWPALQYPAEKHVKSEYEQYVNITLQLYNKKDTCTFNLMEHVQSDGTHTFILRHRHHNWCCPLSDVSVVTTGAAHLLMSQTSQLVLPTY